MLQTVSTLAPAGVLMCAWAPLVLRLSCVVLSSDAIWHIGPAGRLHACKTHNPDRLKALSSYVDGMYGELDKLARKSPREEIPDLALTRVNRAIRDAKAVMTGFDEYVPDLAELVAAGDNPEVRDAVLVLGEIKTALERVRVKSLTGYR